MLLYVYRGYYLFILLILCEIIRVRMSRYLPKIIYPLGFQCISLCGHTAKIIIRSGNTMIPVSDSISISAGICNSIRMFPAMDDDCFKISISSLKRKDLLNPSFQCMPMLRIGNFAACPVLHTLS